MLGGMICEIMCLPRAHTSSVNENRIVDSANSDCGHFATQPLAAKERGTVSTLYWIRAHLAEGDITEIKTTSDQRPMMTSWDAESQHPFGKFRR